MEKKELTGLKKAMDLRNKRIAVLERLVAPARAAANACKDAKMDRTADPLLQVLFEIEAAEAEFEACIKADPEKIMLEMLECLGGGK